LVFLTANNQHSTVPLNISDPNFKEKYQGGKNTHTFLSLASSKIYTLLAH
jgi:hypothetical protein